MALEQDIRDLTENIDDLNDAFRGLNTTLADSLQQLGVTITRDTKAIAENTEQVNKNTKAQAGSTREANRKAQQELDAARHARTLSGRLEELGGTSISTQKKYIIMGNAVSNTGNALSTLGSGAFDFAKGLAQGNVSFGSLNGLIDSLGKSVGNLAGEIPFIGGILRFFIEKTAEVAKLLNTQLEIAVNTFQEVSNAGGLSAQGMSGLLQQFQESGMTLDGFKKAIVNNSQALAIFGGTVGTGAERLSEITRIINTTAELGDELRALGFKADEFGEAAARFVGIQTRLGFTQGRSNQELARSTAAYLRELDLIAKITGQTREESQKRLEAMLVENRFAAELASLPPEIAEQLRNAALQIDAQSKEAGRAFRAGVGGLITDDTQVAFNTVGIDLRQFSDMIIHSGRSADEAMNALRQGFRNAEPQIIELARVLDNTTTVIPNLNEFLAVSRSQANAAVARNQQAGQAQDGLTKAAVGAQKGLEDMSRNMSALTSDILPKFADVIKGMITIYNAQLKGAEIIIGKELRIGPDTRYGTPSPPEGYEGMFASGGTISSKGFGIVGERGPELVIGPASVVPLPGSGKNQIGSFMGQIASAMKTAFVRNTAGPKAGYTGSSFSAEFGGEDGVSQALGQQPAAMPSLDRTMEQQVGMLGAQLGALEEIVRAMRESNSISTRILQAANN